MDTTTAVDTVLDGEVILTRFASADLSPMDRIDQLEKRIIEMYGVKLAGIGETPDILPLTHHFTPGLYSREIFMPAGAVVVSKIHATEHPYVVLKGNLLVYTEDGKWEEINAPHFGITKPGRRRVLLIGQDTVWITFHPTNKTDPADIERDIIIQNPLLEVNV